MASDAEWARRQWEAEHPQPEDHGATECPTLVDGHPIGELTNQLDALRVVPKEKPMSDDELIELGDGAPVGIDRDFDPPPMGAPTPDLLVIDKCRKEDKTAYGASRREQPDFNQYQAECVALQLPQPDVRVLGAHGERLDWIYPALGLVGEAGEVADKLKKVLRDDQGIMSEEKRKAIALELGDTLWYVGVLAQKLGYTLQQIADMNLEKLHSRQARGTRHGSGDDR